jgi:hypothetical protein
MSGKKRRKIPNAFQKAVSDTPALGKHAYHAGLKALTAAHRKRIQQGEARILGSINLDGALCQRYPNEPRWDYGIGIQKGSKPFAIWVEVHPASTSNVSEVLSKLRWLKEWLSSRATQLHALTPLQKAYHWIATNEVGISLNSPQARQLAKAGMTMLRRVLNLDELSL